MSDLKIIKYTSEKANEWDNFCKVAFNSTFIHTRLFLNHQNNKFKDLSVLIYKANKIIGLLPAAESLDNKNLVVSHPGLTYGGIIHNGKINGEVMIQLFEKFIIPYYFQLGYHKLVYKAVPYIYNINPCADDLYAFFRLSAHRLSCNLSSAIDLHYNFSFSKRRQRAYKKLKDKVVLSKESFYLKDLYEVIKTNLKKKYDASPVHSINELEELINRFPHNIRLYTGFVDDNLHGGLIVFISSNVWHLQYISSTDIGLKYSILDFIIRETVNDAKNNGVRFFDFGTSNEDFGKALNTGLYKFKTEFGGGGVVYETYEVDLK